MRCFIPTNILAIEVLPTSYVVAFRFAIAIGKLFSLVRSNCIYTIDFSCISV